MSTTLPLPEPGVSLSPEDYAVLGHALEAEIARVIVGQAELVRQVLTCLLGEGHALVEGVPGLGKTLLLRTLGRALDLKFSRIQFTPDLMPADILGTQVLTEDQEGRRRFEFSHGPIFGNLVLADEVNRATPKTQSALLEAMQETSVTIAGETRRLPRPFFVMATQNPIEMEGTYPLPEAQLDRFLLKIHVGFPTTGEIAEILQRTTGEHDAEIGKVLDGPRLSEMAALTRQVPLAPHLASYAARLVSATHPESEDAPEIVRRYVRFGASPRGAQAMVLAAKATALLNGRLNVAEEDLKEVALPALRHRLILSYEAFSDDVSADGIVKAVLDEVPAPRQELEQLA